MKLRKVIAVLLSFAMVSSLMVMPASATETGTTATLAEVLNTELPAVGETAYVFTESASVDSYTANTTQDTSSSAISTLTNIPVGGAAHYKFSGIENSMWAGGNGYIQILGAWTGDTKGFAMYFGHTDPVRFNYDNQSGNDNAWDVQNPEWLDISQPFEVIVKDNSVEDSITPVQLWISNDGGKTFTLIGSYARSRKKSPLYVSSTDGVASTTISATVYTGQTKTGVAQFEGTHTLDEILTNEEPAEGETAYVYEAGTTVNNYALSATSADVTDTGTTATSITNLPAGGAVHWKIDGISGVDLSNTTDVTGINLLCNWGGVDTQSANIFLGSVKGQGPIRIQNATDTLHTFYESAAIDLSEPFEIIMKDSESNGTVEYWYSADGGETFALLVSQGYSTSSRTPSIVTKAGCSATISATVYNGKTKLNYARATADEILPKTGNVGDYAYKTLDTIGATALAAGQTVSFSGGNSLPAGGALHYKFAGVSVGTGANVLIINEDRAGWFKGAVSINIANFDNGSKMRIQTAPSGTNTYVYLGSAEDTPITGAFEIILKDTNSGSTPIEFWFKAESDTKFKLLGSFAASENDNRTSEITAGGTSTANITSATMYKYAALTQDDVGGGDESETPEVEGYFSDFVEGEDTSVWVNNSVNRWVVDTASGVLKGDNNAGVASEMNKVSRVTEFADDFVLTARLRWPVADDVPFLSGIIVRWDNCEIHVKLTYQQYQYFDGSGTTLTGDLRGVLGSEWQNVRIETYNNAEGVKFYLGDTLLFDGLVKKYDASLGENTVSFYTEQNFLGEAQSAMEIDWVEYIPVSYSITIDEPANGSKFQAGSTISLSASTTKSSSAIPYVDYKINGVVVATGTAPDYSAVLTNLGAGTYSITAEYGSELSASKTFSVIQLSSGSISATANGSGGYTLSAGEYTGLENVSRVEFLVDGVPVGEDTSAPYSFELSYLTPENHKISAHYYSEAGLLLSIAEKGLKPSLAYDDVSESFTNEISYTVSDEVVSGKYNVKAALNGATVTSSAPYELGTNTVPVNGAILYKFSGVSGTTMQGGNGNIQLQNLWTDASKGYMIVLGLASVVRIQDSIDNKHIESTAFAPGLDEKFDLSQPFELLIKDNSVNNSSTPIQYWLKFGDMEGFALLAEFGYATEASRTPIVKASGNASAVVTSITIYECPDPVASGGSGEDDGSITSDDLVVLTNGADSSVDLNGGTFEGNTLRVSAAPSVTGAVVVAGYTSNWAVKEVEIVNVAGNGVNRSEEIIDVSGWAGVTNIKAYLWDGINTMRPIAGYAVKSFASEIDTTIPETTITFADVLPTAEPAAGETAYVFTQSASVENYEVDASTAAFSQTTGDAATMATVPVGGAVHYKFPEGISGAAINGGSGHVNILGSWSNGKGFNLLLGNAGGMIRFQDITDNKHYWYNPTGFDVANPFEIIIKDNRKENSSTPVQLWLSSDGGETFELVTEFNYAQSRTATVSATVAASTTISATVYTGAEKTGAIELTETAIEDILSAPTMATYELSNGHHKLFLTHTPSEVTYLTADGEESFVGGTGRFDIITQGAVADVYRNGQLAFSYYMPQTDEITQNYTADGLVFSDESLSIPEERETYFSNTDLTQGRYSYRLPSLPYAYRTVFVADSTDDARVAVNDSLFRTDVEIRNGKIYVWTVKLDASEPEYIELCNAVNADNVYYHIETVGGMNRIYGNGKWLSTFRSIYSAGEPSVLIEVTSGDGLDYVNVTDNQDLYIYNDDFTASAEFDSVDYWQATGGMEVSYDEASDRLKLDATGGTNSVAEITAYAGDQSLSADVIVEHEVGGAWMVFQHSHTNKWTKVGYNFDSGKYEIIYSLDGVFTTIAESAGSFPVGETVHLELVVDTYDDQRTITFYVNGSPVISASDDKGSHRGKIGFMLTNNTLYLEEVSYRGDAKPVLSMTDTVNNGSAESGGATIDVIEQNDRILTPTQPGNSKYTSDGGKTWAFGPSNSAYGQNVLQLYEEKADGTYALGDEVLSFKPESIADTDIYGRELGNVRVYHSSDRGVTWQDWGYMLDEAVATTYFMTADGVKQGPSGRIYAGLELPDAPGVFSEDAGTQQVWYSDDGGRNWTGGEIVTCEDVGSVINEIQVIESQDGIVTMYYRTDTGMIRAIKSYDRGATWDTTHIYRTPFISASNCFGIQVDPTDGKTLYAAWGYDNANLSAQNQYPRQRWSMARSTDNGESWEFLGTVYECTAGAVNTNMNVMINVTTDYLVIANYCLDAEANVHTYNRVIMVEKGTLQPVKSFEQVHLTSIDMLEAYTGTTFEDMSQFIVANDDNGVVFVGGRKVSNAAQSGAILLDCVASYIGATVSTNSSGDTVLIYAGAEIAIDNVTDIDGRKYVDRDSIAEQFGFAIYTTSDGICYFGNIDQQVESVEKRFLNGTEIAD